MAYTRDPVSLEYDEFALTVLAAIQARRTWTRAGVPVTAWVDVPWVDLPDNVPGSEMTRHERAFVRSLYYNLRFMQPRRSIQRPQWGVRNAAGRRQCSFLVFADGGTYIDENPGISYISNPAMQTAGR
jgi:hypothetical protein